MTAPPPERCTAASVPPVTVPATVTSWLSQGVAMAFPSALSLPDGDQVVLARVRCCPSFSARMASGAYLFGMRKPSPAFAT